MYPWDVDEVHTNTKYLLRELGRGSKLIRDSKSQRFTKGQEIIKLNRLRMKPEAYSCTPMYRFTIYLHMGRPPCFSNRQQNKFTTAV